MLPCNISSTFTCTLCFFEDLTPSVRCPPSKGFWATWMERRRIQRMHTATEDVLKIDGLSAQIAGRPYLVHIVDGLATELWRSSPIVCRSRLRRACGAAQSWSRLGGGVPGGFSSCVRPGRRLVRCSLCPWGSLAWACCACMHAKPLRLDSTCVSRELEHCC